MPELPGKHRFVSIIKGESLPSVFLKKQVVSGSVPVYLLTSKDKIQQNIREMKNIGLDTFEWQRSCQAVINRINPNIVVCRFKRQVEPLIGVAGGSGSRAVR